MGDKRGKMGAGVWFAGFGCGIIAFTVLVVGCAGERTKPMAQPTSEQVKSNADRTFDKLKQEERDRKPADK